MTQDELLAIANRFEIEGPAIDIKPLGNGLINTTYKVTTDGSAPDYVMQLVNTAIFPDPDMLMNNIVAVTRHIHHKLQEQNVTDIERRCLHFEKADNGKYYLMADGKCWRIMRFIPDTTSQTIVSPDSAYIVGKTFGEFQAMLSDINMPLGETIADFHNMEFRLQQMREAISKNAANRLNEVKWIVDELESRSHEMCKAERLYREGVLPKRICHCDTKVDNILFDTDGNVLCVIDLDTVMPNFVFSDFGDFLRSAANTAKEDEADLSKVTFDMTIFKPFARGYIESAKSFLTPVEIENLPYAACLFPYMQTVRFLTDYINGDTYYRILYPEHNLVRSKAQFQLLKSAEGHLTAMKEYIDSLL